MKKIRSILIMLLLMLTAVFYPGFVDISKSAYIGEHEVTSGTVNGTITEVIGSNQTTIFYFDSYTGVGWYDGNMVDGNEATLSILYPSDGYMSAELDNNTCDGTNPGTITKVEVRAKGGYTEVGGGTNKIGFTPFFSGTSGGDLHLSPSWTVVRTIQEWTPWVDITTDTNAPASWVWSDVQNMHMNVSQEVYDAGNSVSIVQLRVTVGELFNVTRTAGATSEKNNLSIYPSINYSNIIYLKIPVSSSVQGIIDVVNNSDDIEAVAVNGSGDLVNNTYWYDSANQFVYIETENLSLNVEVNWTVNCSYGATFNVVMPEYIEVGDYFFASGLILNSTGNPISGIIATTRILYADGSEAIDPPHKWSCANGNYWCVIPTSSLIPGIYTISIEFTDTDSGIIFKEGGTLYLSTDPGSGIYISTFLHFTFYNNNTGIGIPSESFKIYSSTDTIIDSTDRIYVDLYGVYTGQTIYYRVDDYFDNQIYPLSGDYETLVITSVNQFEDVPINWHSFSVKNMNHSIVLFNMSNDTRIYEQFLFPYEPFYWDVLGGEYTINLTYYNTETDAIENYNEENITISSATYYWIRGYDLQDIILEIQFTNTTIGELEIIITSDISFVNSTVNTITSDITTNIELFESNITNINNNIWNTINITDSIVSHINSTLWNELNYINNNISWMNSTTTYVNDTIWNNFTIVGEDITILNISIHNAIDLSELNLTALNINIWNDFNLTDAIIGYLNNTIWNNFTIVDAVINNINNKLTIDFDLLNVTVDYINNTIWTEINAVNSNIGTVSTLIHSSIVATESNITAINNNVWNSINITDSMVNYINNTIWNEISAVNLTVDYLNNTIWTNLSLIDSDIDTLSVSVHTNLEVSETNISNVIYTVWSSLNLTNATIDHLNATIWNEIDIINSNLNWTNLTITNMILLTENNITSLLITINNIIDYALTPDIEVVTCNPPMVFSVYEKEGMSLGVNVYKICPALITIATTRVETTGNWINSTAQIPGNNTVTNGTVTILSDELYISGSGVINWVNITYTDNGTLYQNTTYIPSKINLYGQNLTINASGDIHILRETQYNQLKKFYWTYYADTGRHTTGIDIINSMSVPMYDVYNYVEFSNQSTPNPTTVVMRDVSNAGVVLKSGEHYDITSVGIHFYLLSISSDSTRGFTFEYYKRFDDAYRYGEETISIPGFTDTAWNGLSFNTFEIGWINNDNTIFRGGLFAKLDFEGSSDINPSSIRIWDENNNYELNESDFICGSGFIRIDASGLGDINPGSGRRFSVYFLLKEYPGADPTEIHLNTPIWLGITPFLIILLVGLCFIGYGAYSYMYKNKKDWKNGVILGVFIIFIFYVLAYMGI